MLGHLGTARGLSGLAGMMGVGVGGLDAHGNSGTALGLGLVTRLAGNLVVLKAESLQ